MKNKKTILLWLDDVRNPFENDGEWQVFAPIQAHECVWVKNYDEFVAWITDNGLPTGISFDHDLADEHLVHDNIWIDFYENGSEIVFQEKTGMDCAKWLIEYCLDNKKELPKFSSHSSNPCGRKNIEKLLINFLISS